MKMLNKLKEINKKTLGIIVASIIVIIGAVFLVSTTLSSPTSEMTKDVVVDSISIKDITLENKDNITTYTATVEANEDISVEYIDIILKDESGNVVVSLVGYIGKSLKSGETTKIKASTDATTSNVTSIEYKLN